MLGCFCAQLLTPFRKACSTVPCEESGYLGCELSQMVLVLVLTLVVRACVGLHIPVEGCKGILNEQYEIASWLQIK